MNYGLRKGLYQSLSKDELAQLTSFEGYDKNTITSPDGKLAVVETTMFSDSTSFEIIGLIPTPYSVLASYFFSIDILGIVMFKVNVKSYKGNLGPALVELEKAKKDKNYKGVNLKKEKEWNFNGFTSWSPDGKKFIFDETYTDNAKTRLRLVKLKNYEPDNITLQNNFDGTVPYARNINEILDLRLNLTKNITINGISGDLNIYHFEGTVIITYNDYSEDNETFYNGIYHYEKFSNQKHLQQNYSIFEVDITSKGKKEGYCNYRLWLDLDKSIIDFDEEVKGRIKTYGDCNYDGIKIDVNVYK